MASPQSSGPSPPLPLSQIEEELSRQMHAGKPPGNGEAPIRRARMSNLVIFCNSEDHGRAIDQVIPSIVANHPARVLLLVGDGSKNDSEKIVGNVTVWSFSNDPAQRCFCDQITLRASGPAVEALPYAVRELLIGDLPTNLWWAIPVPPPLSGPLLHDLAEQAQQIIYDSIGWPDPARGVVATAAWLGQFERVAEHGFWRIASDINWRRLKYWRRLLTQAFDPASAPGALASITEVIVEHGPHAVVQAWELTSWMASRLGWQVAQGSIEPNVEIAWQVTSATGNVTVRLRRLAEGPSDIRRVRIACTLKGKSTAVNVTAQDGERLAAVPEGQNAAERTVTIQHQSLAELVARQLSDRERDPRFRASMAVAQVFAKSVLGS